MADDTTHDSDPLGNFRFQVEFDGVLECGFTDVSGLEGTIEYAEYNIGGLNNYVVRLPKGTKQTALKLKRGMTTSSYLWDWYQDCKDGIIKIKQMSIILMDITGQEAKRWAVKDALPVKWTGPTFSAKSADVAFEEVEITHRGISKVK